MPLVLYEDEGVAVINKPAGISVHPAAHNPSEITLIDFLLRRWPEMRSVGEDPLRPGIVHRLDKEASGVLVVAKTRAAFLFLKKQFQERTVEKTYLVLVIGRMPQQKGEIEKPIFRSRRFGTFTTRIRPGKVSSETFPKKMKLREAATAWKVLKEYRGENSETLTLLSVTPKTGRTHQIRVHLAAIGHPVAGDPLYGGKAARKARPELGRMFLHAFQLRFTLPSGRALLVEADLPPELKRFLETLPRKK
jgi:23S rRNA pseudouridine1911/1915/1917 synthase